MMAVQPKERRQFKNFLLVPRLQLKYLAYLLSAFISLFCVGTFLVFLSTRQLEVKMLALNTGSQALQEDVEAWIQLVGLSYAGYALLILMITIGFIVIFTHRFLGPTVAILRHIEALKSGNYKSEVILRKNDHLNDVATALNELAQNLEGRSGKR